MDSTANCPGQVLQSAQGDHKEHTFRRPEKRHFTTARLRHLQIKNRKLARWRLRSAAMLRTRKAWPTSAHAHWRSTQNEVLFLRRDLRRGFCTLVLLCIYYVNSLCSKHLLYLWHKIITLYTTNFWLIKYFSWCSKMQGLKISIGCKSHANNGHANFWVLKWSQTDFSKS